MFSRQKVPWHQALVLAHGHGQPRTKGKKKSHTLCQMMDAFSFLTAKHMYK